MSIFNYKSMWFNLDAKQNVIERSTYSLLDWLGDVGGLFDGLILMTRWFVSPMVVFALRAKLLSQIFREDGDADLNLD